MEWAGIFLARPERPADGISLAVKDLFDTAGLTTTYGSRIFSGHVPETSAEAVVRAERAGYANVGKTNLHEFAYGITSKNPWFGKVPNPVDPGRIAGGSSGGSAAAVAAGLADAALGTDSGGSIRIPAACCGIAGFKPSHGRVPLDGCFPLAPTFDTVGPMAPDVAGCAQLMRALDAAVDPAPLESLGDLEAGLAWSERAEPLVRSRVEAAAARFPRLRRVDAPLAPAESGAVFRREVAGVHRDLFTARREEYGKDLAHKVELALTVTDEEYEAGRAARDRYREAMAAACREIDLLLTPTLGLVAPPVELDDLQIRDDVIRFTFPFNFLGWPALALPCGSAEDGLPASLQIVSPRGDDALVLAAGRALEALL